MGWFTPYKRKANDFRYTPRYFDPEKERRDLRRRELCGESSADSGKEYEVGQYIRTQREARAARRAQQAERRSTSPIVIIAGVALLLAFVYLLYPRIIDAFATAKSTPEKTEQTQAEEFDPYAPIAVVPNDYKEE